MLDLVPERYERFALALANTYDPYVETVDALRDPESCARFVAAWSDETDAARRVSVGRRLIDLRDALRSLPRAGSVGVALSRLRPYLEDAAWTVSDERGGLALVSTERSTQRRLAAMAAIGAASLLARFGVARLRACRAAPCEEMFVDSSKSGRQVYCSKRCANRVGAARFRRRARAGAAPRGRRGGTR